ncbi:hypothetical protein LG651_07860 [Tamlana sp. 62-3]|uniref:Uncharacterized protein n=1 Tax=Neotamlana sargassicola TaxID=2883125 RepID=A0A9X1I6H2_9FLAO|nr:hypothetical protein [Tamlana sargassicola]MCB4808167.1 hypothetical protein [Tamlana sargassicola]
MKYIILLLSGVLFFSCGNKKTVQLPEINNSEIQNIKDVSAAYIFYDPTQTDSVLLNRKNLISTTNWLVNIDKRLTLRQVIPQIKFLQEKKANAGHKNENAKNYFSCNDISKNNLGFIEFTKVNYEVKKENTVQTIPPDFNVTANTIFVNHDGKIFIISPEKEPSIKESNKNELLTDLKHVFNKASKVSLRFSKSLTFQDYITIKSLIKNKQFNHIKISNTEFIN